MEYEKLTQEANRELYKSIHEMIEELLNEDEDVILEGKTSTFYMYKTAQVKE